MSFPKSTEKVHVVVPEYGGRNVFRYEDGSWSIDGEFLSLKAMKELSIELWPYIRELSDALKILQMDINADSKKKSSVKREDNA